ncbi:MAG: dephospho-CoA kinase [Acidobacteria bacterium]|nr:dephospho-CoA kinase [Acidobacteriota bacterium]
MNPLGRTFGLTGGAGSGKSTVAGMFAELGARVIDADRVAHQVIRSPQPAYHEIVREFGFEILDSEGEIDRKRQAAIVFADPEKLKILNAIVHPRVMERIEHLAEGYLLADPKAVVIVDAALLYEAGHAERFHKIIVAWSRPEQQIERLMARMRLTREQAELRIAAQMPAEEKRRRADYVIDCSGDLETTRTQVNDLFSKLQATAAS